MRQLSLLRRIEICLALLGVLPLLAAVGAIQLQQRILYHRVERLLRDIQSLTLRQSTFSDAQVLFHRWGDFGKFHGACSEKHCEFQIAMETFVEKHRFNFFGKGWLLYSYVRLGARPARVFARIGVENGIVWGKGYVLEVGVHPHLDLENGFLLTNLIGPSGSVSRFAFRRPDYTWYPEYLIGSPSGCEGCIELYDKFTSYAPPRTVQRLMDVNLSCVLPWSSCQESKDIMPGAWNQMYEDSTAHPRSLHEPECNEQTVGYLARDTQSAAIVEVLATRTEKRVDNGGDILFATVRILTPLKRMQNWNAGPGHEIRMTDQSVAFIGADPLSQVRPGRRFILLLDTGDVEEPCEAVPLTPHNLDLVSRGISLDYLAPYPELEIQNLVW